MSTVFPASRRAAIRSSRSEEAGSHRPRRDRLELRCHQNAAQGNQVQACAPAATSLWREPAGQHAVALLGTHIVTKGKARKRQTPTSGLEPTSAVAASVGAATGRAYHSASSTSARYHARRVTGFSTTVTTPHRSAAMSATSSANVGSFTSRAPGVRWVTSGFVIYIQADATLGSRGSHLTDRHIYRTDATGSWIRPLGGCEQVSASQQPHPPPPRPCFSCGCGGGGGGAKQD